jgi:O-antigen/teichoic acid export membrane protein
MKKRLRDSFLVLLLLQGGQNLSSLLLLPLLTRALGAKGYGELGFCIAFIGYFVLFVEWGFGLGASQKIAIYQDDIKKRSEIFWNVIASKFLLATIGAFALFILTYFFSFVRPHALLLWLVYLTVIAVVFAPSFYYQGMEKLEGMFLINLLVRFASLPIIFIMVKDIDDIAWAIGIQAGALLFAALINFIILISSRSVMWVRPSREGVFQSLKESLPLFLSSASSGIYASSVVVILGLVSGALAVGYFVGALNLIKAGQGLLNPLSQVLFPRLSHLFQHARGEAVAVLKKAFLLESGITLLMVAVAFLLAPIVLPLLMGQRFDHSVFIFQILTPLFFFGALSNLLGQQAMITLGMHDAYTRIIIFSSVIGLFLVGVLSFFYSSTGAAISLVLAELLVVLSMASYLRREDPKLMDALKIE